MIPPGLEGHAAELEDLSEGLPFAMWALAEVSTASYRFNFIRDRSHAMRFGIIGDELQRSVAGRSRLLGLAAGEEDTSTPDLVAGPEGLVGFEADRLREVPQYRVLLARCDVPARGEDQGTRAIEAGHALGSGWQAIARPNVSEASSGRPFTWRT